MSDPSATGPLTHGFLFADLRGYTAYAEANGDAAAADLLDRYRVIVRAVVADLGGAEIKTEGDSFYVVFPSASRAVAAGLAIVAGAAESTVEDPGRPIRVGVGVHAGEAEERAEGYVGTAVNIAARVCAQARPGEVLVTETVRSLTRTSGRYRFVGRGRPTLKGIAEPVALYAAEDAVGAPAAPARREARPGRRSILGAGIVVLGVIVLAGAIAFSRLGLGSSGVPGASDPRSVGLAGSPSAASAAAPPSGTPAPSGPRPFHTGRLDPGTYASTVFEPNLEFTVPAGWNGTVEIPSYLELTPFGIDDQQLAFITPSVGYVPCSQKDYVTLPAKREDLVAWLTTNKGLDVHLVGTIKLGGTEAIELDVGLGHDCGGPAEQPLFLIQKLGATAIDPDDRWVVTPGPPSPMYVIDAGGNTVVALVGSPVAKLDAFKRDARSVLSSLELAH